MCAGETTIINNYYTGCCCEKKDKKCCKPENIPLDKPDFSPTNSYQNNVLKGLSPVKNFNIFTDEKSGTIMQYLDSWKFDSLTGTIYDITPGRYIIIF